MKRRMSAHSNFHGDAVYGKGTSCFLLDWEGRYVTTMVGINIRLIIYSVHKTNVVDQITSEVMNSWTREYREPRGCRYMFVLSNGKVSAYAAS
jgi:hypothetical protein